MLRSCSTTRATRKGHTSWISSLYFYLGRKGAGYEAVLSVILRGFLFLMVGGLFLEALYGTNMFGSEIFASNHRKYKASKFYKL